MLIFKVVEHSLNFDLNLFLPTNIRQLFGRHKNFRLVNSLIIAYKNRNRTETAYTYISYIAKRKDMDINAIVKNNASLCFHLPYDVIKVVPNS